MKKQITVKEKNSWEGETFNYVIIVDEAEKKEIIDKCERYGNGELSVSETNYTNDAIKKMDNASSNGYMDFIAPYKLGENSLTNWTEFGDCFYKGNGLTKLKVLEEKIKEKD